MKRKGRKKVRKARCSLFFKNKRETSLHTDASPPNCAKKRKSAYPSTGEKKKEKEKKTFEKPLQHIL